MTAPLMRSPLGSESCQAQQVHHISNGRGGSQQEDICRNPAPD